MKERSTWPGDSRTEQLIPPHAREDDTQLRGLDPMVADHLGHPHTGLNLLHVRGEADVATTAIRGLDNSAVLEIIQATAMDQRSQEERDDDTLRHWIPSVFSLMV